MKRYVLFIKILLLVLLSVLLAFLIVHRLYFTAIMIGLFIAALAYSLYYDQQKTIRRMEHLISNIHYGDLNITFSTTTKGAEGELTRSMNEALSAFRTRLYNSVVAEAENEAWQKLIRVLTHEIMNSIAPIISLSETVTERAAQNGMNEKDYEVMLQAIQTIHRRSQGLLDFVENYRKLTRIPMPVPSPFLAKDLFDDMKGLFFSDEVSFVYSVVPDNLYLNADRSLIEQVLINLLKNALEASSMNPLPEVQINAFRENGAPVITVADNGSGILPEVLDKVFVPFFTTKPGGSGIGLSVCRQIMNRHGGSISVTSEVEKGTTFTMQFPHMRSYYP